MMESAIEVVTPATNYSFLSLDEIKIALGIDVGDDSRDPFLQQSIDFASGVIGALCNRTFFKEAVVETFNGIESPRIYLSRYPVLFDDITSVTANGVEVTDYLLDEQSGKLTLPLMALWSYPVVVEYSGGFELPDEAPLALKQATILLTQERYTSVNSLSGGATGGGSISAGGVRMISHKDSRVMYYQATESSGGSSSGSTSSGGGTAAQRAIEALLSHYIRIWA